MTILNFNVERLKIKSKQNKIFNLINSYKADVIILTETNSEILHFQNYYFEQTLSLPNNHDGIKDYKNGENRVTIYSKLPIINKFKTFDDYTSLCVELETNEGNLIVYATIIGVFGYGKYKERFISDFNSQIIDLNAIFTNKKVCLVGDLNISLSGRCYPSLEQKNKLKDLIKKYNMNDLSGKIDNNIDHILISNEFICNKQLSIETFNKKKYLSDHIGLFATIK